MSALDREKLVRHVRQKQRIIRVAAGEEPADLVLKNATYLNVFCDRWCHGDIAVAEGRIAGIGQYSGRHEEDVTGRLVVPGFIDAHIHLESAAVLPTEFARAVLPHGTTTVITDPHEIANVMGTDGIEYMLQASEGLPVDVRFMLPSCVPATPFDESGSRLGFADIDGFYDRPRVLGLAEMMNYPGVLSGQEAVLDKIAAAQLHHKKIDGHAPGLSGRALSAYIAAGVYSDHECATLEEAMEKLEKGQYIMIREGTAAHNLEALWPLLKDPATAARCLLATDDKHPNDLLRRGHIDHIVRQAVAFGADPLLTLKVASHYTARYFLLNDKGAVAPGYRADLTVLDNLSDLAVCRVYCGGQLAFAEGKVTAFAAPAVEDALCRRARDTFRVARLSADDFVVTQPLGCIGLVPEQLLTEDLGMAENADAARDILKAAVIERHHGTGHIGLGFVSGYGLRCGAIATSVSHDSHNLIVIGANDADMATAANRVAENGGGMVVVENGRVVAELPLPIAGLLSDQPLCEVDRLLEDAREQAHARGVRRDIDPFMTLSFMSLPVIPTLRLTTRGVVDVETQQYR